MRKYFLRIATNKNNVNLRDIFNKKHNCEKLGYFQKALT